MERYSRAMKTTTLCIVVLLALLSGCGGSIGSQVQMVDGIGHIYVQGDHNGHPFQVDDTWGEDTSSCGAKETPCLTIPGALSRAETLTDTTIMIHLGGWSDPSSIGGANDPWDGYATETRVYEASVVPLRTSKATRNTLVYVGPTKMVAAGTQPVGFLGAVDVGLNRVLLKFTSPNGGVGSHGLFLRFVEGSGRELFFPHVVSEATSMGLIVDTTYNASNWNSYAADFDEHFEITEPGAHIVGSYIEPSSPVLVMGSMPPAVGDTNDGVDLNPLPAASRVIFYRPRYIWTGELYLDAVWSDVESRFYGPGTLRQRSGTFCNGGTVIFSGSAGRVLAQDSGHDRQHERAGWARVPVIYGQAPTNMSDPYAQFGGPIDMTVSGGLMYIGGRGEVQASTVLRIYHGLSVYRGEGTDSPIQVMGPSSFLDIADGASLYSGGNGAPSITATIGAFMRYNVDLANVGTVKVGRAVPATLTTGQRIDGDDGSAVWDRSWETTN